MPFSHHTPIKLRPATVNNPKQPRQDVYFSGLHCSTTIDDIRAYLIDIGVANIESIALITDKANSKSNCFRVIITDESINHSVYDPKRCADGRRAKLGQIQGEGLQRANQDSTRGGGLQ